MAVAARVLRQWKASPGRAPIPVERPAVRDAFLHGALAPDMGFVPGNRRLVSEAAHYLLPGDLTRALLAAAGSDEEEAFAWGWASHLLADVEIHPVVGRAVGERLYGDRGRRMDALADVATHVSLEVGLDIAVLRREGAELPAPPARPFFPHHGRIRFLTRALEETYGVRWDGHLLAKHHVQAVRLTRWWPRALRLLPLSPPGGTEEGPGGVVAGPGELADGPGVVVTGPGELADGPRGFAEDDADGRAAVGSSPLARVWLGTVRRVSGQGTPLSGFLAPEAPRRWFMEEVLDRFDGFPARFQRWVDAGLDGVGNPNMETGEASGVGRGHPATDLAARKLAAARAGAGPVGG